MPGSCRRGRRRRSRRRIRRRRDRLHLGPRVLGGRAGETVGAVLQDLASQHPATQDQLFGADGSLNRYVNVYLNDEDVRVLDGLDTGVGESDTLVILPAMAGG